MNTHQQQLPCPTSCTTHPLPPSASAPLATSGASISAASFATASAAGRTERAEIPAGFGSWLHRHRCAGAPVRSCCKLVATVGWVLVCWVLATGPAQAAIRLNELYPAPQTGESEWVELFNDSATDSVDLTGWLLQDQVSSPSVLAMLSNLVIEPESYLVVEWSGSKLNNSGDEVVLYDASGNEVERVGYTNSQTGQSWALVTLNGSTTWQLQSPTPGSANLPPLEPSSSPSPAPSATPQPSGTPTPSPNHSASPCVTPSPSSQPSSTPSVSPTPTPSSSPSPSASPSNAPVATTGQLTITAVMACPLDGQKEWVELYNTSSQTVSLTGWYLTDAANNKRYLSGEVGANQFGKVEFASHFINNSGETLYLHTPSGQVTQNIELPSCDEKGIPFIDSASGWLSQDQLTTTPPNTSSTNSPTANSTQNKTSANQAESSPGLIGSAGQVLGSSISNAGESATQKVADITAKLKALLATQKWQLSLPKQETNPAQLLTDLPEQTHSSWGAWLIILGGSFLTTSNGARVIWKLHTLGLFKTLTTPVSN